MLQVLVYYDVQVDRERQKVNDICLDYGLDRQQYSVFAGNLTRRQLRALGRELGKACDNPAYICIVPIRPTEWDTRLEIGEALHDSTL